MSFRCPIGVGKAQEAPIATAIGKLSASTPSGLVFEAFNQAGEGTGFFTGIFKGGAAAREAG